MQKSGSVPEEEDPNFCAGVLAKCCTIRKGGKRMLIPAYHYIWMQEKVYAEKSCEFGKNGYE